MATKARAKYQRLLKAQLPKDFEVHHIDGDKNNNDIKNLVALPVDLHRDYHKYRAEIERHVCYRDHLLAGVKAFKRGKK